MKTALKHFYFFTEKSDTVNFSFLSFRSNIQPWASTFSVFSLNLLTLNMILLTKSASKFKNKVLDFFSDTNVKKNFKFELIDRAKNSLSYITEFLITSISVFYSIREQCADGFKRNIFFRETSLELTFFYRKPEVEVFFPTAKNFGMSTPYLLYRKF